MCRLTKSRKVVTRRRTGASSRTGGSTVTSRRGRRRSGTTSSSRSAVCAGRVRHQVQSRDRLRAQRHQEPLHRRDPCDEDIFSYRALLVNLWTRPHRDTGDWNGGWAWIVPFGDFSGGDLCVTELRRRILFPAGAVLGLRGGALEHWTTCWSGRCRFSLVHTFHQYVRDWNWTGESSSESVEKYFSYRRLLEWRASF